jgi:neural Wiskott-Aldrich syndrome protein
VETIPRRMRVGVPAAAQVRIGRERIDSLILLLMKGRGLAHRPEALASRSLSVRLKAPDGGFWIEPVSPETQWAEPLSGSHQHDEQVTWRWTVTPQQRGRGRLVLVVTARTVGQDGLATEAAPPDRVIEVAVSGGRLRRTGRWIGLFAALGAGAVIGRFSGELWAIGAAVIRRLLG